MENTQKKPRKHSIQTKLIIIICVVLVVFAAIMSVISTSLIRYSTTTALEQSMRQTAKISAGRVSDVLELKVALIQSISSRVGALYEDCIALPFAESNIAHLEAQMTAMAKAYGFDLLYCIDAEGYSRTSRHTNMAELAPEYYTAIAEDEKPLYMSDIATDSGALGGSVINISAPITGAGGARIGVLVGKLDASLLVDLVTDISVGENGSAFIVNNEGLCIAHKDPEICFGGSLYTEYRGNPKYASLNRLWDDMRDNEEGFTSYEFNGDRLAAYATVEGTNNWALAVAADDSEFMAQADNSVVITIIVSAAFLVVAFFVCLLFIRPITRRITAVTRRLEQLSQGDLGSPVPPDRGTDEVSRLSLATKTLVLDLGQMIDATSIALSDMAAGKLSSHLEGAFNGDFERLKLATEQNISKLGTLVHQISCTAEEVSRGSIQIADAASGLAQGAAEQAGSIEELYSTVTELTSHTKEISDRDRRAEWEGDSEDPQEADEARLAAAATLVEKLSAAMQSIRARIAEIAKISSVIDSISRETGMLALNASVEATHAGEYGRGFAVIAAEVRELSEKCRRESRRADEQIERILRAVAKGDQVVCFTIDSVEQMATSISQVERALSQVSAVIENTAATAEESAASSEELSAQSETLLEMVSAFQFEENDSY